MYGFLSAAYPESGILIGQMKFSLAFFSWRKMSDRTGVPAGEQALGVRASALPAGPA
jgi:hypothetical protein